MRLTPSILLLAFATAVLWLTHFSAQAADVRSKQSGPWSAKETWDTGSVPLKGDRVIIRPGHTVAYDVDSQEVIRLVQIAGTLDFARDRNTRLEVGLVTVIASEEPTEDGFDCHATPKPVVEGQALAALLIGQPGNPIPGKFQSLIRLHYIEGMDKETCPTIVCCAGRMEIHGEPMKQTWVKLKKEAQVGATTLASMDSVSDWKVGDKIVISSTRRPRGGRGGGEGNANQNEERRVASIGEGNAAGGYPLTLDAPLTFEHYADETEGFQGEIANLSRNVIIESANPDGVRGHTMYHKNSAGSISYAEFRHLGKQDILGKYSIHFHLCGNTMRGSSVIGASIWDSQNRLITIHGTDDLVIRDCVGFKNIGHAYFLEDGTETNNIIDHNVAILVVPGKPLPKQNIPFDENRGAGFWWANCQNSFTRNVAVDCGEYGFTFECKKTQDFDPVQAIRQPDGTVKNQDTRVMPFIRFEDNEAHSMRQFCLSLRGAVRPVNNRFNFYEQANTLAREAAEAIPATNQPFVIRNFRAWEANYSVHLGTAGVMIDGLDSFHNDQAIWRSIIDHSIFRRLKSKDMKNDIFYPISMGKVEDPNVSEEERKSNAYYHGAAFTDVTPPVTMITSAIRKGNQVLVRGSAADSSDILSVRVNGQKANSTRGSYAEWEITLDAPGNGPLEVNAYAVDDLGYKETSPHRIRVDGQGDAVKSSASNP